MPKCNDCGNESRFLESYIATDLIEYDGNQIVHAEQTDSYSDILADGRECYECHSDSVSVG